MQLVSKDDYLLHNPNMAMVAPINGATYFILALIHAMAHMVDATDTATPLMADSQYIEVPNHLINPLEF